MFRTTATTTALALAMLSASPATAGPATASPAALLAEEHYSQDGYEVDLYVTDGPEGQLTEATLTDPTTGDAVDMWVDGESIHWHGTLDGELAEGSMPMLEVDSGAPEPQPYCFTPVTALLCLGIVVLSACATTINACPDRETVDPSEGIPGGGGGVPQDPGGGDGESEGGEGEGDSDGD